MNSATWSAPPSSSVIVLVVACLLNFALGEEAKISKSKTTIQQQTFTVAEVSAHSSDNDCWMILYGNVYDITSYFGLHPGGDSTLSRECGKDATQKFELFHSENTKKNSLPKFLKGAVGTATTTTTTLPTTTGTTGTTTGTTTSPNTGTQTLPNTSTNPTNAPLPQPLPTGSTGTISTTTSAGTGGSTTTGSTTLTLQEVAKHKERSSCWMVIDNKVYDFTGYFGKHPGGNTQLARGCGIEATALFDRYHNSRVKAAYLPPYHLGAVGSSISNTAIAGAPQLGADVEAEEEEGQEAEEAEEGNYSTGSTNNARANSDGGSDNKGLIIAAVAGGVILLLIVAGVAALMMRSGRSAPMPPMGKDISPYASSLTTPGAKSGGLSQKTATVVDMNEFGIASESVGGPPPPTFADMSSGFVQPDPYGGFGGYDDVGSFGYSSGVVAQPPAFY